LKSKSCDCDLNDSLIRDRIVIGNKLKEKVSQDPKPIEVCRIWEPAKIQMNELNKDVEMNAINIKKEDRLNKFMFSKMSIVEEA